MSVFAIAGTYVGTVVGAGFATGQEVLRFFTFFGIEGIYGLIGATVLFALLGAVTLQIAHRIGAHSHREVMEEVTGPFMADIFDWILAFFLFTGAAIMMAGSGAVFAEHWHLNRTLGTVLMAAASVGTVWSGLRGVIASISAVAPVLIGMVLLIGGWSMLQQGLSLRDLTWSAPQEAASPWWPVAALLYVSYNLLLSVSVLAPLGGVARDAAKLRLGGVIGGVALGMGALAINLAMLAGLPESTQFEVPMLHLTGRLPGWIGFVYGLVLWAEIYTTAVSSLFGLTTRFVAEGQVQRARWFTVAVGVGALAISQLGFANMVAVVFPAVGWLGLIFVFGLILRLLRGELQRVR